MAKLLQQQLERSSFPIESVVIHEVRTATPQNQEATFGTHIQIVLKITNGFINNRTPRITSDFENGLEIGRKTYFIYVKDGVFGRFQGHSPTSIPDNHPYLRYFTETSHGWKCFLEALEAFLQRFEGKHVRKFFPTLVQPRETEFQTLLFTD